MVGMAPISAAVITACTPGRAPPAEVSIARIRPCATELRKIAACSRQAGARSSTYWPRPRTSRRSSMRSIGLPMKALAAGFAKSIQAMLSQPHPGELPLRQLLHGVAYALAAEPGGAD